MNDFVPNFGLKQCLMVVQDKMHHRRKKVLILRSRGFSNVKISTKLGYSLSTIEKDLNSIRQSFEEKHEM